MAKEKKLMSKKKPTFPINEMLNTYLKKYKRNIKIPIFYDDLLRFQGSINVYDKNDKDTLWIRTYYSEYDREEIDTSLKQIYTMLHSDGSNEMLSFLNVDAIDYCTFGNSKPFRIKIRNILNDNYTYFYVKKADASRVYGLELEHILSPHNMNFLVYKDTLIEEHIAGIPGDSFITNFLPKCTEVEKAQIAKEFVKFKERCLVRLLGDMRSYNYVIIPTHDFDHIIYKIRAIDFDQQSFEGNLKVYNLQFMKENFKMVEMVSKKLQNKSINQFPELDTIGKKSVGSIIGMHFDIAGQYSGILAVYFYSLRELSSDELEMVTALGEQGTIALQKAFSFDEKMVQNFRQMVEGFTLALEAKDESTHGHSVRVATFARLVAEQLSLAKHEVDTIYHGGLLHDIGKIGMHDHILERLGILSRKEMDIVKQHPVIGARIAKPLAFLNDVVPLILHHHERFDGSGYPDGLKGSAIPQGARILTVCDAFETMLAGRKHFARMRLDDAIVHLYQGAGTHFDPAVVEALLTALLRQPADFEVDLNGAAERYVESYCAKLRNNQPQKQQFFF